MVQVTFLKRGTVAFSSSSPTLWALHILDETWGRAHATTVHTVHQILNARISR